MYKIAKIEKTKKKGIYKIHFENTSDLLLHEDVLLSNDVLLKSELSEQVLANLKDANDFSSAYYEAIRFITRKLRSKFEITNHLKKKEFYLSSINEVVSKLEQQGYVNDLNYAKSYANTIMRTSNKGIDFIKKNLVEHKISAELINQALDGLDYNEEYDKLYKLVSKRIASNKKYSGQALREKMFYEFKTKGFKTDLINEIFNEMDFSLDPMKLQQEVSRLMKRHNDKKKVKHLLMQKGFSSARIDEALMKEGYDGIY